MSGPQVTEQGIRAQVKELGGKFLQRTATQVAAFREQLARLASGDATMLTAVQEVAHKIHGSGAVFGFAQISDCAGQLELSSLRMSKELGATQQPPYAEWTQELTQSVDDLARALEAAQQANR